MLALWFPVGIIVTVKCNIFRNKPPMYGRKILLPSCTQTHSHARTLTHSLTHPRTRTQTHIHTHTHTHTHPYIHHTHTPYTQHTHTQHTYTQHTYTHTHTHTHTHHAHALRHVKYSSTPGIKCGDNRREFCLVPSWCKCTTNMLCTPHNTQDKQWCGWTVGALCTFSCIAYMKLYSHIFTSLIFTFMLFTIDSNWNYLTTLW